MATVLEHFGSASTAVTLHENAAENRKGKGMKVPHFAAAVATALAFLVTAGWAQQTNERQQRLERRNEFQRHDRVSATKSVTRASQLIGMEVKNHEDEELGSIEDLAIDATTGKIEYAAVSMGGFLGLGDKLFAVPWAAIECRPVKGSDPEPGEEPEKVAVVQVNKETLENAEGFDQDNWPDMANERWRQQNDRYYKSTRRAGQSRTSARTDQDRQK